MWPMPTPVPYLLASAATIAVSAAAGKLIQSFKKVANFRRRSRLFSPVVFLLISDLQTGQTDASKGIVVAHLGQLFESPIRLEFTCLGGSIHSSPGSPNCWARSKDHSWLRQTD